MKMKKKKKSSRSLSPLTQIIYFPFLHYSISQNNFDIYNFKAYCYPCWNQSHLPKFTTSWTWDQNMSSSEEIPIQIFPFSLQLVVSIDPNIQKISEKELLKICFGRYNLHNPRHITRTACMKADVIHWDKHALYGLERETTD